MRTSPASALILFLAVAFPSIAGCQSQVPAKSEQADSALGAFKKIADSLPPLDPNDAPAKNPEAKPPVRLSGKLSGGMHVKLYAIYSAFAPSHECRRLSPSGKPTRLPGQYQLDLKVAEANGRFESSFSPDLFLPGDCDWRFVTLGARVSPSGKPGYDHQTESLIEAIHPKEKADASGCVSSPEGACPLNNNWLQTPVLVPCGMYIPTNEGSQGRPKLEPFFYCRARTKGPYKVTHRLKGDETKIEIDFIDLRSQPDPT